MNITVLNEVTKAFAFAMKGAFPTLHDLQPIISVSNPKFGDYQCNNAMMLFKNHRSEINNAKSPYDIANMIGDKLSRTMFNEVNVAKQGFITVKLSPEALKSFLEQEMNGKLTAAHGKSLSCLVDYSSPNIAKEMHVGHLRSTLLGESICRLLEFVGHKVMRVNHVGDWGTQFGMLIQYMKELYPDFQQNLPNISDLTAFYREAKLRFDGDVDFKKRAQIAVTELQGGDKFARDAWKLFCDVSTREFQQIYDRFGVNLILRGESFYNDMIPDVLKELNEAGILTDSEGAKCVFVENDDIPLMAVKSDGGYGYDSTDLAAIKHRLKIEHHDWVIYVTDIGQENHFMKIFKAAKTMGWHNPPYTRADHVGFGLIQGEDGKKFKTRSGDLVKLADVLDEAVERASKEIENRRNEDQQLINGTESSLASNNETELSVREAAEKIGYSAIRYFDLKQNRITNYRFSYDKMLDPKGNTAVYLLYAYARICAIFRKAAVEPTTLRIESIELEEPQERELALQMLKLYEIINSCLEDLHIHRIAEYVYDLSGAFTNFYQNCKVVGSPKQESRLLLCELTRRFFEILLVVLLDAEIISFDGNYTFTKNLSIT